MDLDLASVLETISGGVAASWLGFRSSAFFFALRIFLFVYILVLIADIVMLVSLRGIGGDLRLTLFGGNRPIITKSRLHVRWNEILNRLRTGNMSQYKAAVLEADALADEVLAGVGYQGTNMGERLSEVGQGHISSLEELVRAHAVRNRIIQDAEFPLSRAEAELALTAYRNFFDEMELF